MKAPLFVLVVCLVAVASAANVFAQRGEIVIPASDLAKSEQRSDMPTPGKWWLNRNAKDWGRA